MLSPQKLNKNHFYMRLLFLCGLSFSLICGDHFVNIAGAGEMNGPRECCNIIPVQTLSQPIRGQDSVSLTNQRPALWVFRVWVLPTPESLSCHNVVQSSLSLRATHIVDREKNFKLSSHGFGCVTHWFFVSLLEMRNCSSHWDGSLVFSIWWRDNLPLWWFSGHQHSQVSQDKAYEYFF